MSDTKYQDFIVCPHCSKIHYQGEEYDVFYRNNECASGVECEHCGKPFDATRHVSVTYSTSKPEESP